LRALRAGLTNRADRRFKKCCSMVVVPVTVLVFDRQQVCSRGNAGWELSRDARFGRTHHDQSGAVQRYFGSLDSKVVAVNGDLRSRSVFRNTQNVRGVDSLRGSQPGDGKQQQGKKRYATRH
jgi:hypothetical protein